MTADSDLVAAVVTRVAQTEMARRIPEWDGRPLTVPPGLPPLTLLVGQAFPISVLERRLRFLRLMGWYPDQAQSDAPTEAPRAPTGASAAVPSIAAPRLPEVTVEDRLAALYGAAIDDAPPSEHADPALGALRGVLRAWGTGIGAPADTEARAALTAFFDQQADAVDPGWRDRWPRRPEAVSAWARSEAAGLHGGRLLGRGRRCTAWRPVSGAVWRLAEFKRRRWK